MTWQLAAVIITAIASVTTIMCVAMRVGQRKS